MIVITLITSISYKSRIERFKLFPVYLSLFIILFATDYVSISGVLKNRTFFSLMMWSLQYVVSIVEFLTFIIYISFKIQSRVGRLVSKSLSAVVLSTFVLTYILYFNQPSIDRYYILHWLYVCQSIPILAGCGIYYFQFLKVRDDAETMISPSFWIITGISLFSICTLPISIAAPFILVKDYRLYNVLFSLIYFFYIVLFIFILKAYKCSRAIPK